MLLSRAEMTHPFGGAKFDIERDREVLAWMFNQFLYGEVTGIQCGHWMYNAPSLEAARFLAKQSIEEFQHIDNFLRCLALIGAEPAPPHRVVRYLSSGMMPDTWAEHVSLEMAFGEGLVLMCFYALIDTVDQPEIVRILSRAVKQEESHVDFGEVQTQAAIAGNPGLRRRLLGLNLVSLLAVGRVARYLEKTMDAQHPVFGQVGAFLTTVQTASELRLQRLGLLDRPLAELKAPQRAALIGEAYGAKALRGLGRLPLRLLPLLGAPRRLTETYLADPAIRDFSAEARAKVAAAARTPEAERPAEETRP